jgi:hypothetical protein
MMTALFCKIMKKSFITKVHCDLRETDMCAGLPAGRSFAGQGTTSEEPAHT